MAALNQIIRLGSLNRTTSYEQKDKLQLRECRIIYRKKPLHTPGRSGQFASTSSAAPPLYIDPNEILRHQIKTIGGVARQGGHSPPKRPTTAQTQATPKSKKRLWNPPPSTQICRFPDQLDSIFDQMIKFP